MRFLGFTFGGWAQQRAQQEAERYSLRMEALRDNQRLHELLAAERAEKAAAEELLAAEKLRNADLKRRLDAAVSRLDVARLEDLNNEKEGPKRDLEKFNDAQAARAMSRNTKQAFQVYQRAVTVILDRLNDLGKGNHVTKEDLRKLRELRKDLSDQIQRTI